MAGAWRYFNIQDTGENQTHRPNLAPQDGASLSLCCSITYFFRDLSPDTRPHLRPRILLTASPVSRPWQRGSLANITVSSLLSLCLSPTLPAMSAGWTGLTQAKSQGMSLHKADLQGTCRVCALRTLTPGEQGNDGAGPRLTQELL